MFKGLFWKRMSTRQTAVQSEAILEQSGVACEECAPSAVANSTCTVCHVIKAGNKGCMMWLLLLMQVDIDESDFESRTALHVAAANGHKATVRVLVERYMASHNVQDRLSGTPLDDAIRERHMDVVRYLAPLSSRNQLSMGPEKLIQVQNFH